MQKIASFITILGMSLLILYVGFQSYQNINVYNSENYEFSTEKLLKWFDDESSDSIVNALNNNEILNFKFDVPFKWLNVVLAPFKAFIRLFALVWIILNYVLALLLSWPTLFMV